MTSVSGNHALSPHKSLAIFASGAGTNAQKIIQHFSQHPFIKVRLIACNNPAAGVIDIAVVNQIDTWLIDKEKFFRGNGYTDELKAAQIDFIVLAGFLWKIPQTLINAFKNRIVNIHPALLPKFGGKGMYGTKVHEAVIAAGEIESGITIHFVDEHYDNGDVIFQANCSVSKDDTAESLAQRIHRLEHEHYARIVENIVSKLL
jgi:phosphoribosylglycinamide formyltransferase-1